MTLFCLKFLINSPHSNLVLKILRFPIIFLHFLNALATFLESKIFSISELNFSELLLKLLKGLYLFPIHMFQVLNLMYKSSCLLVREITSESIQVFVIPLRLTFSKNQAGTNTKYLNFFYFPIFLLPK